MTVAELLNELNNIVKSKPAAARWQVVLSRDPEGNGFSPLYEESLGFYKDGEIESSDKINSVILWPE